MAGSPLHYWTHRDLKAGQRYVILSEGNRTLQAMVEEPNTAELETGRVDVVGDVELILDSTSLPLAEQAQRVATALSGVGQHGWLFAQYTAALPATGSDADAAVLLQALGGRDVEVFSDHGKLSLLGSVSRQFSESDAPDNLVQAYVNLTVRYFVAEPEAPVSGATGLQREILDNDLRWIKASERGSAALRRMVLPEATAKRLRSKALECAGSVHLTPEARARARELLQQFAER